MFFSNVRHASTQLRIPEPRGTASQHLWTFERGVSQNEIFISLKKKVKCCLIYEVQTKVQLQRKTYVLNNNIERVAPFNRLFGATQSFFGVAPFKFMTQIT